MGSTLCLGLLPVDADCTHGFDTLSVSCTDVYPDGLGHAYCYHPHVNRYHYLFNDGWLESCYLGRCHTGYYINRWSRTMPGHSDVLHA